MLRCLFIPSISIDSLVSFELCHLVAQQLAKSINNIDAHFAVHRKLHQHIESEKLTIHAIDSQQTLFNELLANIKPDIIVLDGLQHISGIKAAAQMQIKIVLLSDIATATELKQKKSHLIEDIDLHLIYEAQHNIEQLNIKQRLSWLLTRHQPHFVGPIFDIPSVIQTHSILNKLKIKSGKFILLKGSYRTQLSQGKQIDDTLAEAAQLIAINNNVDCVVVFNHEKSEKVRQLDHVISTPHLNSLDLINLMQASDFCVLTDELDIIRSVALNTPTIALTDNTHSISEKHSIVASKLVLTCQTKRSEIVKQCQSLIDSDTKSILKERINNLQIHNGLQQACALIEEHIIKELL